MLLSRILRAQCWSQILLPALLLLLCFTSCDEDTALDQTTPDLTAQQDLLALEVESTLPLADSETDATPEDERPERCLSFVYPISFELANDEIVTIEDQEQMRRIIRRTERRRRAVSFVYPFELSTVDGQVLTIGNFRDFRQARRECGTEFGRHRRQERRQEFRECFDIVFPIDLTVDEETVTVDGPLALLHAFRQSGDETRARIDYPISVEIAGTGEVKEIANRRQLKALRRACAKGE